MLDTSAYVKQLQKSSKGAQARTSNASALLDLILKQNSLSAPSPGVGSASAGSPVGGQVAPRPPVGEGVDAWISQALGILKMDNSYLPGIRNMIMKESSGNPRIVNNWDSNAKKGTPSKGLMQTIDSTFQQWALPGYNQDVFDPVSNIIAGIRYAQNRYGDEMLKSGGRKNSAGKYIGY